MILKCLEKDSNILLEILKNNHHLKIVSEDFQDDGEVYVVEVEEI